MAQMDVVFTEEFWADLKHHHEDANLTLEAASSCGIFLLKYIETLKNEKEDFKKKVINSQFNLILIIYLIFKAKLYINDNY